jgi:hypothetical protein
MLFSGRQIFPWSRLIGKLKDEDRGILLLFVTLLFGLAMFMLIHSNKNMQINEYLARASFDRLSAQYNGEASSSEIVANKKRYTLTTKATTSGTGNGIKFDYFGRKNSLTQFNKNSSKVLLTWHILSSNGVLIQSGSQTFSYKINHFNRTIEIKSHDDGPLVLQPLVTQ